MTSIPAVPSTICWPDGINETVFLRDYWQQQPLLIRQAFPDFDTPMPADELAGLSLEPDTTPRLIIRDETGHYHLEHGPFDEERFASLDGNNWSLLVTDVEKHLPDLACYLTPFQFLPSWRIDDLMISYAPTGASVGAHIDEYDVFLLQASGTRRWSIDRDMNKRHSLVPDASLKLVSSLNETDSWDLQPGDMLYLPPGVAHHGVAVADPCTTWSIGFRAPALADAVLRMGEMIAEALPAARYTDPPLSPAVTGEISSTAIARFLSIWREATTTDAPAMAGLVGRLLTESGTEEVPAEPLGARAISDDQWDKLADSSAAGSSDVELVKAPFSRMAWHELPDEGTTIVMLYVNGDRHQCSRALAMALCAAQPFCPAASSELSRDDWMLLKHLYVGGSVVGL